MFENYISLYTLVHFSERMVPSGTCCCALDLIFRRFWPQWYTIFMYADGLGYTASLLAFAGS